MGYEHHVTASPSGVMAMPGALGIYGVVSPWPCFYPTLWPGLPAVSPSMGMIRTRDQAE